MDHARSFRQLHAKAWEEDAKGAIQTIEVAAGPAAAGLTIVRQEIAVPESAR